MIPIGTRVRIRYPEYVAGRKGRIQAQEAPGRWLVRVEENPLERTKTPVILSLEASDFEIIHDD